MPLMIFFFLFIPNLYVQFCCQIIQLLYSKTIPIVQNDQNKNTRSIQCRRSAQFHLINSGVRFFTRRWISRSVSSYLNKPFVMIHVSPYWTIFLLNPYWIMYCTNLSTVKNINFIFIEKNQQYKMVCKVKNDNIINIMSRVDI